LTLLTASPDIGVGYNKNIRLQPTSRKTSTALLKPAAEKNGDQQ
jgi:hypothetical protein